MIDHKQIKGSVPEAIQILIQPIFEKLGSDKFVDGSRNLHTLNQNQSCYHNLWCMALKKNFFSSENRTSHIFKHLYI